MLLRLTCSKLLLVELFHNSRRERLFTLLLDNHLMMTSITITLRLSKITTVWLTFSYKVSTFKPSSPTPSAVLRALTYSFKLWTRPFWVWIPSMLVIKLAMLSLIKSRSTPVLFQFNSPTPISSATWLVSMPMTTFPIKLNCTTDHGPTGFKLVSRTWLEISWGSTTFTIVLSLPLKQTIKNKFGSSLVVFSTTSFTSSLSRLIPWWELTKRSRCWA